MIINLKEDDTANNIKTTESGYAVLVNTEEGEKYFTRFLKTDDHEDCLNLIVLLYQAKRMSMIRFFIKWLL